MRDLNGDGIVTYQDVLLLIRHIFFVPGNFIIYWCYEVIPGVAQFFELAPGGTVATLISLIVWGFAFLIIVFLILFKLLIQSIDVVILVKRKVSRRTI